MQSTLRERLERFSHLNQELLFERLESQLGVLSAKARLLVSVLGMICLSRYVAPSRGWRGRPSKDRQALATAFLAKAILKLNDTPVTGALTKRSATALPVWLAYGRPDSA
jgi:hypothetical protein